MLLAFALPVSARNVFQTLTVSAQVSPSAVLGFEISAEPLQITSQDLDRGYVDVVMKSRMQVTTARGHDARPPIVLSVEPRSDLFKAMGVATDGANANGNGTAASGNGHSKPQNAEIVAASTAPSPTQAGETREFRYRFEFSKSAREGHYETAISVSIDL